MKSFPLDGAGRLTGDVVSHPIDAAYLVDDAVGGTAQKFVIEGEIVCRHTIAGGDGSKRASEVIGARIAHYTNGPHRQQDRERLPDGVIETGVTDLLNVDRIGLA